MFLSNATLNFIVNRKNIFSVKNILNNILICIEHYVIVLIICDTHIMH